MVAVYSMFTAHYEYKLLAIAQAGQTSTRTIQYKRNTCKYIFVFSLFCSISAKNTQIIFQQQESLVKKLRSETVGTS